MDFLLDSLPVNQLLYLGPCDRFLRSHFPDKTLHHFVSAGIHPVILRRKPFIVPAGPAVADHVPGTVNLLISEPVPIVPFLHSPIVLFQPIVPEHLSYFRVCKTEILVKLHVCHREHTEIVEPSENTLLRHPQAAGEHREIQVIIRFQHIFKEVSDQQNHAVIIAVLAGLRKRHIVLIDQHNRFLAIMLTQKLRKLPETEGQRVVVHISFQNVDKKLLILFRKPSALQQELQPSGLFIDNLHRHSPGCLEICRIHSL